MLKNIMGIALADMPSAPKWRECGSTGFYERMSPKPQGREFINPFTDSLISVKNNVLWPNFPHPITLIEDTELGKIPNFKNIQDSARAIAKALERNEGGRIVSEWFTNWVATREQAKFLIEMNAKTAPDAVDKVLQTFRDMPENQRNAILSFILLTIMEAQARGHLPYPQKWNITPVAYLGTTREEITQNLNRVDKSGNPGIDNMTVALNPDLNELVDSILEGKYGIECD